MDRLTAYDYPRTFSGTRFSSPPPGAFLFRLLRGFTLNIADFAGGPLTLARKIINLQLNGAERSFELRTPRRQAKALETLGAFSFGLTEAQLQGMGELVPTIKKRAERNISPKPR